MSRVGQGAKELLNAVTHDDPRWRVEIVVPEWGPEHMPKAWCAGAMVKLIEARLGAFLGGPDNSVLNDGAGRMQIAAPRKDRASRPLVPVLIESWPRGHLLAWARVNWWAWRGQKIWVYYGRAKAPEPEAADARQG